MGSVWQLIQFLLQNIIIFYIIVVTFYCYSNQKLTTKYNFFIFSYKKIKIFLTLYHINHFLLLFKQKVHYTPPKEDKSHLKKRNHISYKNISLKSLSFFIDFKIDKNSNQINFGPSPLIIQLQDNDWAQKNQ